MKYYKKVQGEKVYLSPGNVNDAEKFVEWLSDPSVTDPLGVSHDVYNIVFEKNWLETNLKNEKIYFFAIVKQCDNQMIGSLSLMDIHQINGTSTIGLFIGDEKNRGKGYGTEAVELGIKFGFDVLNLNNIGLKVYSFNQPAVKSYLKAGFKEYGRRRQAYYLNGEYHDVICMDIIREDYYSQ